MAFTKIKLKYTGKIRKATSNSEKKNGNGQKKSYRVYPAVISREIKAALNEIRGKDRLRITEELFTTMAKIFADKKMGTKEDKPQPFDFKTLSKYANPAIDTVTKDLGQYNPDTIDVTVYELMRKDPQLAAGLAMVKLPIISLPWRIECDDIDVRETVSAIIKPIWKSLIHSMMTAVDFGFAAHEKVWERKNLVVTSYQVAKEGASERKKTHYSGDAAVLKKVKPLYPSSVQLLFDDDEFKGIKQDASGANVEVLWTKCFVFTHDKEFGNMFGKSRLKPAYKMWYWKELMYQFMLQYYERRGSPPIIVTAPPGATIDPSTGISRDNLQIALDLGSSFINNSVGALPYDETKSGGNNMWKVEYLLDDRRGTMFIDAIKHLDSQCLLALWVPETLGGQSEGGSYARATVIADLFLMSEKALISEVEDHVNQFIIPQIVNYNFLPDKRIPAYIKLDQLDWNRRLAIKEIFIEMIRNQDTMMQQGISPKVVPNMEKMAEILEIPIQEFTDSIQEDQGIAKPPPQGGGSQNTNLKPRRRSDSGRTETRKSIKPGTKPAVQQRTRQTKFAEKTDKDII